MFLLLECITSLINFISPIRVLFTEIGVSKSTTNYNYNKPTTIATPPSQAN